MIDYDQIALFKQEMQNQGIFFDIVDDILFNF